MKVYNSSHLLIKYEKENSRLISTWKSNPPNNVVYKAELLEYLKISLEIKPCQMIWILDKKTFKPNISTKKWVDEVILNPIFKSGFVKRRADGYDQLAFVIGQDVSVLIQGIESPYTGFNPKYFANEREAYSWLSKESKVKDNKIAHQNLDITFKGVDDDGKIVFELKEDPSEFSNTITLLKNLIKENHFMKNNIIKFSCLTKREQETLKFIINGNGNTQIAEKMRVSPNTIRTHRNRICQKLEISNFSNFLQYKCFFN